MAQVIKLKRSAVAGKTPQTSSLQLGELAVNTTDGKIYLHRSSSSDDSIQSVLTTDATITGSLKLSGSQHISGSTNVMDDLTYGGNLSASIGSTSSFDRFTSVGTSSIGFLIASGSNFATFTNQTSSFASGSDVQQILDESGSYLVDTDTGSLGKVTLVSDITSSITSTASFGKIFGDGSDLDNVADPAAISGSFQGGGSNLISGSLISTGSFGKLFGDGGSLTNVADPDAISGSFQGGGSNTISGSLISTASFGKLELVNSHGFVRSTETGSFASGSDLHQFLAESSSYVVESETGSFASGSNVQTILDTYASGSDVQGILDTYASGSDLHQILAESSSYVVESETGSFASGSDLHQFLAESASYVVDSDTGSLHQVLAESSSYLNNDTTSSFGAVSMDSTLFVQGDITTSGSVIAQQFRTEFVSESIIFASGSTKFGDDATDRHRFSGSIEITGNVSGSITSTASFGKIFGDGGNLTNVADPDAISGSFQGGGSNTISGSILSTGSFGKLELVDTVHISPFGSGSDLHQILAESASYVTSISTGSLNVVLAESASYVVSTNTGSYASGSDLHQILAESSSYVVESETGSFVVNSQTSSFASGSNVQTILDTYASGSDLHQILAESSSYVVESETGSFVVNSQTSSFASGSDLQIIQAESASYVVSTNTGSFLQNSDTASFQSTIITSSLEITGSITIDGDESAINLTTDGLRKFQIAKNTADDFKINRYDGTGSFVDQPITIASSSGITTIKDQLVRTGGVTFLQGAGSTTDGVGVYNDMKVGIGTGTTAIGDEKFLVAGDTGITGSLFVSSSITTSELVNNTGTLKVSQSVSDGDIEISVNDGGSTINAITIDASSTGRVLLKNDNQRLYLGAGNDLYLNHDGTNSYVSNETGNLNIINYADDKELRLYSDNGSGGTTPYLTLDGSITKTTLQKDISGSLGTTGSFDRLEGVTLNATISPFASGSDVSQIQALTSSYATGSDLHQFLAESASYLVNTDTGSLGLLTLGNNITGSITSTASFGSVVSPGISTFGTIVIPNNTFIKAKNSAGNAVELLRLNSSNHIEIMNGNSTNGDIIFKDAGDTNMTIKGNTGGVGIGSTDPNDDKLLVAGNAGITGDLNVSGSITANEYIINSSVTNVTQSFSSGSTIFGDSTDDTHEFSGSVQITGSQSVVGDLEISSSIPSIYFVDTDTPITNGIQNYNGSMRLFTDTQAGHGGSNISFRIDGTGDSKEVARFINKGLVINVGSQGTTQMDENFLVNGDAGITGSLHTSGSITTQANISGSITSTGSFGTLSVQDSTPKAFGLTIGNNVASAFSNYTDYQILLYDTGTVGTSYGLGIKSNHMMFNSDSQYAFYSDNTEVLTISSVGGVSGSITSTGSFGELRLPQTGKLWFDAGSQTYIQESQNDVLDFYVGGQHMFRMNESGTDSVFTMDNVRLGAGSGPDLVMHHDGTNSFIDNETGYVKLRNLLPDGDIYLSTSGSEGQINAITIDASNTGRVKLPNDNQYLAIGASGDLYFYHDGSNSTIRNATGNLILRNDTDDGDIIFQSDDASGGVTAYITLDGSAGFTTVQKLMRFGDDVHARFGTGSDLRIFHNGTNSRIDNYTGTLQIRNTLDDADITLETDDGSGGVTPYITLDGSAGYTVASKQIRSNDNVALTAGTDGDLNLVHDGTDSYVENWTGDLYIRNNNNDKDVILQSDDGSGGVTAYLTLDGSITKTTFSQDARVVDSKKIGFGNADDLQIYHDGTNSHIVNTTGNLHISSSTSDADILFSVNDGGTILEALKIDASDAGTAIFNQDIRLETNATYLHSTDASGNKPRMFGINASNNTYIGPIDSYAGGAILYGSSANVTDQIFYTGASERMRIDSSGNVGIGTNSPASNLHIQEATAGTPASTFASALSGSLIIEDDSTPTANNILIKSHGVGDGNAIGGLKFVSSPDGGNYSWAGIQGLVSTFARAGQLAFYTAASNTAGVTSTERMRIDASGNVGIGNTAPTEILVVEGNISGSGTGSLGHLAVGGKTFTHQATITSAGNTNSVVRIDADDGRGASRYALDIVDDDSNSRGSVRISTTSGPSLIVNGDVTGSIATTASFGKIVADQYSLATLAEVSGGFTSTGSFGHLQLSDSTGEKLYVYKSGNAIVRAGFGVDLTGTSRELDIFHSSDNGTNGQIAFGHRLETGGKFTEQMKLSGTGTLTLSGSMLPYTDNSSDLGSASKRFNDVFAVQTTVGAVFETGLRTKGIGQHETGTIVVWRNGGLVPCDKSEDTMVMGVTKKGKDEPIVMGAEPVLVTGDVKEGDFITTSTKQGHGKKLENGYLLKKEMFGKVIAQALEDSTGESSLIKCMIRKM